MNLPYLAVIITVLANGATCKELYPVCSIKKAIAMIGNNYGYIIQTCNAVEVFSQLPEQAGIRSKRQRNLDDKKERHFRKNGKPYSQSIEFQNFLFN